MSEVKRRLTRTAAATGWTVRRRDAGAVVLGTSIVYLFGFLLVRGDVLLVGGATGGLTIEIVSNPLAVMFEPGPGPFTFEPIALIEIAAVQFLFSPLNLLLSAIVAVLVGVNFALSYLAIVRPTACGLGAGSGILAAVPALLSGSACCAPVLLLVLGIGAGGVLLSAVTWLYPIGILLLVLSTIYLGGLIRPPTDLDADA